MFYRVNSFFLASHDINYYANVIIKSRCHHPDTHNTSNDGESDI